MARARNIKPGFYKNEDLAECSPWARLIFPGLWMLADREGRMEDRPKRIKGELLPYDAIEVDPLLNELARWGFILRYEVSGERFIQVLKFSEHQAPHVRESASTIPAPVEHGANNVQTTTKAGASTNLGSASASPRSPDSLNPESLLLNPESPSSASAPARADDEQVPAVQLSIAMNRAGIKAQSADPRLIALAEQGVTPQTVTAACTEAKAAKPGETVGLGYVVAILNRWSAEASKVKAGGANGARASPRQAASENMQRLNERLNGARNHDPDPRIIDLNEPPAGSLG
jgi:hypothetical protein